MTPEEAIKFLDGKTMILPARCNGKTYTINEVRKTAIEALEKQIPKKPNITLRGTTGWNTETYCPVCKTMVHSGYCSGCGQAIKWGE